MTNQGVSPLVTIRVAESRDLEAVRRCRYDVYSQEGFIDPRAFPDGQEFDQYDAFSVSVIATAGIETFAVGTTRLILGDYVSLPIEKSPHFVEIPSAQKAAEISRLCVRDGYRDGRISIAMYRTLFHLIETYGVEAIYAIVDEAFFNTLKWIGFPFVKIGEPMDYMGITLPVVCMTSEVRPSLHKCENANLLGVTALFDRPYDGSLMM